MSHFVAAFECLEALEKTTGRNDKIALLRKQKANPVLRTLIGWAYNGDNYFVYPDPLPKSTKIGVPSSLGDVGFKSVFMQFQKLLEALRSRVLSGHAAAEAVRKFFFPLNSLLYKWLHRVMHHDLRIGAQSSVYDAVWDKGELWPDRVATHGGTEFRYPGCQNSEEYEDYPIDWSVWGYALADSKMDGYRLSALVNGRGTVVFYTRGGHCDPYTKNLTVIAKQIVKLGFKNCMVDGEVMHDDGWRLTGICKRKAPTPEQQQEIDEKIAFHAFDYVPLDVSSGEMLKPNMTFVERRKYLFDKLGKDQSGRVRLVKQWKVWGPQGAIEANRRALKMGIKMGVEGIILKRPDSVYEMGKRPRTSLKWKPFRDVTLKVTGFQPGKPGSKYEHCLGALICENDKGERVNVAGISDEERERYWRIRKTLKGYYLDAKEQDIEGVATSRHPQMLRWRDDKNPTVISRDPPSTKAKKGK